MKHILFIILFSGPADDLRSAPSMVVLDSKEQCEAMREGVKMEMKNLPIHAVYSACVNIAEFTKDSSKPKPAPAKPVPKMKEPEPAKLIITIPSKRVSM